MTTFNRREIFLVLLLVCVAMAVGADAQVFTTLIRFNGTDGSYPNLPKLIQGRDRALYGTTQTSGPEGNGTIFRLARLGITTLYGFLCNQDTCAGNFPSSLTLGDDGLFYGTTIEGGNFICGGGCGTVFKITRAGVLTSMHDFASSDGSYPRGGMVQASDGSFYGTTTYGGANDVGTVFRITPGGTLTTLHSFNTTDGASPVSGLIQATDGNLYGVTAFGGNPECSGGCGTVFKITLHGGFSTLYSFCVQTDCADGAEPMASLFESVDGKFYGTTYYGGNSTCENGCGTVFEISPDGVLSTLYAFCPTLSCTDGAAPRAGVTGATDGNLYGTTSEGGTGLGTAFSLTSGGTLSVLHTFDSTSGGEPFSGLLQATNGIFYGTTYIGGSKQGVGTAFSLDMGLGPFVTFVQAAGRIGQSGGLLGQGFTGTTGVMLNGIPASFLVESDTYIKVTVPPGATTGYVTVNTPSGTLTSNVPFQVIR